MSQVQLKDIMQAVLSRFDGWLYNAALTKFIYLLDTEAVRNYGQQVTTIQWVRDNYGPFVWDIIDCASAHPDLFSVLHEGNKRRIVCEDPRYEVPRRIEDLVDELASTAPSPKEDFRSFKEYIYNTPPMLLARTNGPLDIQTAMEADKDVQETLDMLDTPEWNEALAYLAAN